MRAICIGLAAGFVLAISNPVLATDVPGTRFGGKSTQEPPPPPREGNPFPKNPNKRLKNPLQEKLDTNPTKDPEIARGIKDNYERHNSKKQ